MEARNKNGKIWNRNNLLYDYATITVTNIS